MWKYKNIKIEEINDILEINKNIIGFVYIITNIKTKQKYIGKKILFNNRKTLLSKKEKIDRKKFKIVTKESDWQSYYGSNKKLKQDILLYGKHDFERIILEFTKTKKMLSYYEIYYQMVEGVLLYDDLYYNDNIAGKFFKRDLENERNI